MRKTIRLKAPDNIELEVPPMPKRQIKDYFQSYYEDWINMNIPVLGDQTQVEVAREQIMVRIY
jgi:hypothetical protein